MNLLEESYESFTLLNKIRSDDGYGGVITRWEDGVTIDGAMVLDSSSIAMIAQAIRERSVYTFTVKKHIELNLYDVLRRNSDGKIFRITNDSDEKKTPRSATLNMRQYSAEEWAL